VLGRAADHNYSIPPERSSALQADTIEHSKRLLINKRFSQLIFSPLIYSLVQSFHRRCLIPI